MLRVHVLGSGSGLPTARRDTTSLLVRGGGEWTLVDCPGAVVHRLARLGVRPEELARVLLTHDHVDHVYGLPHLLHAMAIAGEGTTLEIRAPGDTLATVESMVSTHGLAGERYPELNLLEIPATPETTVVDRPELRITASPTRHGRDTRALRFDSREVAFGHTSDTRRAEELAALLDRVDLLTHDCAGLHRDRDRFGDNHSSAREAGAVAAVAGVGELRLIHLSPWAEADEAELVAEAADAFGGRVAVARDGDLYRLPRAGTV